MSENYYHKQKNLKHRYCAINIELEWLDNSEDACLDAFESGTRNALGCKQLVLHVTEAWEWQDCLTALNKESVPRRTAIWNTGWILYFFLFKATNISVIYRTLGLHGSTVTVMQLFQKK